MANLHRKLAGQTAVYGFSTIFGRLLNYLLIPLYTRMFLPAELGVFVEFYAYVSFLVIILTYGMETAFFNFSAKEENTDTVYSTALLSLLVSTCLFLLPVFFFTGSLSSVLRHPDHPEYITWIGLIIALDAFTSIPFARLRHQNRAMKFASIKMINIGANIGFNLFFIALCKPAYENPDSWFHTMALQVYRPEIGVGYIFISNLVASLVALLLLMPEMFRIRMHFDPVLWKKMMRYALPLLIAGLAGMTNETGDRILLKYLLPADISDAQVGIYGNCYRISIIMTIFIQTFRYAAEPFFFSQAKESNSSQVYADVMKYFVIICSLIFLGTMLNMSWIQAFVGPRFRSGLGVVPILLLANLCLGIFFNLSIWYKLSGQTRFGAYLTIYGAIVTLVLNFLWIPSKGTFGGYMGSAWATLICYASMMILSYIIGQRKYPIGYDLARILGYLFISLTLYALGRFIHTGHGMVDLLLKNALLLVFLSLIYVMEKENLKAIISRKS
ncbi:MAG: oligosaccharide flippase family protein [Bacteroidia bacterium]